jgi:hypothetical protein
MDVVPEVEGLKTLNASEGKIVYVLGEFGGLYKFSNKPKNPLEAHLSELNNGWIRVINNSTELNAVWFGANPSDEKDDTKAIQAAINHLPSQGGKIIIPRQCIFYLNKLKFPQNVELDYYATSNRERDAGYAKATYEKVSFMSNANHAGIVNEQIFAAPFHPGFIINVKKDIKGHTDFLGKGQSMADPVRATFMIQDEGLEQVREQYVSWKDFNNPYSGWRVGLFRNTYTFKGISEVDFKRKLKIGELITSEKGKGHLVEKGENYITLQWFSGRFYKGEILETLDGYECGKKLKEIEVKAQAFNAISLDKKTGYMGVGLPNSSALHPLTVGGKLGIQGTRLHGQYLPSQNKAPAIVLSNSFEAKEISGLQIKLNSTPKKNRLVLTDINDKDDLANLGGLRAHTAFNRKALSSHTAFNIKSIKRQKEGSYIITFITPFERADYQVGLSTSRPLEFAYVYNKGTKAVTIHIVKTGTEKLIDPEGGISVICTGGDY